MTYPSILQMVSSMASKDVEKAISHIVEHMEVGVFDSPASIMHQRLSKSPSFNQFQVYLEFAIPRIGEKFSRSRHYTEEDVRDFVFDLLQHPGTLVAREEFSRIGRTDISMMFEEEPNEEGFNKGAKYYRKFRIEFKIWGRKGYREVPDQPLKYMEENEDAACLVMIDSSKGTRPLLEAYRNTIRENSDYECLDLRDGGLSMNIRHFTSLHEDRRYTNRRLLFCVFVHLPILL